MRPSLTGGVRCLALAWVMVLVAAVGASASPILVGFENDNPNPVPINVPNGFESSDSSQIRFSDTDGANLIVLEVDGSNALAVLFDDNSGLLMEFDFVASELSLDFGNSSLGSLGDDAVLTVFLGGSMVDSTVLALNGTSAIDQTISYAGVDFDSAIFRYDVSSGLTELVDNISVTPSLPEPHAGLVFGLGALLFGKMCGRRPPSECERRAMHD